MAAPLHFVVRVGPSAARTMPRWFDAPVPGEDAIEVGLDDVLALLAPPDASVAPHPTPPAPAADPGPTEAVRPAWTWVGRVEGPVVVTADGGRTVALDRGDLELLDRVIAPVLVHALGGEASADRIARLVAVGAVVACHADEVARDDEVGAAAGPVAARPAPVEPATVVAASSGGPPALPHPRAARALAVVARARSEAVERVRTAYRLSSRLAPLRRALGERDAATPNGLRRVESPSMAPPPAEPSPVESPVERDPVLHPSDPGDPGRVPVYAVWHREIGPLLALGMLTAAARRHDGGTLVEGYEVRRPEEAASVLADLARRPGPGVLLLSNYVWSVEANLDLARRALAANPELVVVAGGPSTPKYVGDAERFLEEHGDVVHLLVRGEGEVAICELLEALRPVGTAPGHIDLDVDRLAAVPGLTFRAHSGEVVRTPDRERTAQLDQLPSAYLTGEFDHIDRDDFTFGLPIETNRGCPYGCTFCDWGSSTMSRIRQFSLDRVYAEIDWMVARRISMLMIADANFGILRRDVEIAERLAEVHDRTGFPEHLVISPAKNTIKHLVPINDTLVSHGVVPTFSIALQTVDPEVLSIIARDNISVDSYLDLAADHRRHGLPLMGDVLMGLPGQTYETYRHDLQFNLDHEILPRSWPVQLLPNSPMNDPEYRELHAIVTDERGVVVGTSTFGRADRAKMLRLRRAHITLDNFGVVRHVARWLQWDHGVEALRWFEMLLDAAERRWFDYPHLAWVLGHFDVFTTGPAGWDGFSADVRRFVINELGVAPSPAMDSVLTLQHHLMPWAGRSFPDVVELAHDYPAYYRDATASLYTTGRASGPPRPLEEYPPATFVVAGDPLDLCGSGPQLLGDSRDEVMQGDFYTGSAVAYELDSPLARITPRSAAGLGRDRVSVIVDRYRDEIDAFRAAVADADTAPSAGAVTLSRRRVQPPVDRGVG